MNIEVWDDNFPTAKDWEEQIHTALRDNEATVHAAPLPEIGDCLSALHERRKSYLDGNVTADHDPASVLDKTDILIVDNDLFHLPKHEDLSAETVASRVGVYTDCACIVVLNLTPDLDFDLTLLGHPSSKADVHINDRFVADKGLWHECPKKGGTFRPWHWPLLASTADLYRARVAEIVALLQSEGDTPILDYLGFDEAARRRLSRAARAFLHPEKDATTVSFAHFVKDNTMAVGSRDGAKIFERDDARKIARIGARRIAKWLAQYVVSPQDVLMDLPHLIERLPFLVPEEGRERADSWNSCAHLADAPVGLVDDLGIVRFEKAKWCDRPVFWTEGIETEEIVRQLIVVEDANPEEFVFCEDSSAFHKVGNCDPFVAAHNTMSDNRFIRWLTEGDPRTRYGPQSRLAR